jgi:diaminohydroxyphosphoribosylaminopyrimidine deaminase/5-amino-6-(5-phosphoribosylamino)uracil reductase
MTQEGYMLRCLALAEKGRGQVAPNPLVGCVVAVGDRILGEGYHMAFGGPHAEVHALDAITVEDQALLPEATLYVNLEPCDHQGKTPPCTEKILASGIRHVVIGTLDPNPLVSGKGAQRLRDAGVKVDVGIAEKDCIAINKMFITFHKLHRPYITLKWAQSKDGFVSRVDGSPVHLSNQDADILVHQLRASHMAILVGAKTVLTDNPKLTTRHIEGNDPIRMIVDTHGTLPGGFDVFDGSAYTILFTVNPSLTVPNAMVVPFEEGGNYMQQIAQGCYTQEIQSLLVEGGPSTLRAFMDAGLWDELVIIQSAISLSEGIAAPDVSHIPTDSTELGDNRILRAVNTQALKLS